MKKLKLWLIEKALFPALLWWQRKKEGRVVTVEVRPKAKVGRKPVRAKTGKVRVRR